MDLSTFVNENELKTAIIIDDELSLINEESSVSNLIKERNELEPLVVKKYNHEDLNDSLLIRNLKKDHPSLFESIKEALGLSNMIEMKEKMEKSGLHVIVKSNYCDDIADYENAIWIIDNIIDPLNKGDKSHIKKAYNVFWKNRKAGKSDVFMIYSADTNRLQNYDETSTFLNKNKVFREEEIDVLYVNVINKSQIIDTNILKDIVAKAAQADYFTEFNNSLEESLCSVKKSLWKPEEFRDLLHYNSIMEGLTNDKNLYGIITNTIDNNYRQLKEKSEFIHVVERLNKIDFGNGIAKDDMNAFKVRAVHELRQVLGCEKIDEAVNKCGYDVSFGDIFRIGGAYYLLVSQQCDITIRNNSRKNRFFKLVPIAIQTIKPKTLVKSTLKRFCKNNNISKKQFEEIADYIEQACENGRLSLTLEKGELKSMADTIVGNVEEKTTKDVLKEAIKLIKGEIKESDEILGKLDFLLEQLDFDYGVTPSIVARLNNSYFVLNARMTAPELIVDDFLLDVATHNGEDGLVISRGKKINLLRSSSKKLIQQAFNKVSENPDELQKDISSKYGVEMKEWKRIGNVSKDTANKLYGEYINNQTREAILTFEKV